MKTFLNYCKQSKREPKRCRMRFIVQLLFMTETKQPNWYEYIQWLKIG